MPVVKIILQALFGILILIAAFMALRLFTAWFLHIENILAQNAETNDQLKEIGDAVRRLESKIDDCTRNGTDKATEDLRHLDHDEDPTNSSTRSA